MKRPAAPRSPRAPRGDGIVRVRRETQGRGGKTVTSASGFGLAEDDLLEIVLDAGAEEVNDNGDTWEIVSEATDFVAVRSALQDAGVDYDSAEASWVPNLQVPLDLEGAKKMIRVIDRLTGPICMRST